MPHWLGPARPAGASWGIVSDCRSTSSPVVATMDIPQIMDLGLPAIGGDLPARRLDRRPDRGRAWRRTPTRDGERRPLSRRRRARRVLPRRSRGRVCRWASTRSATVRSSRSSPCGSASTPHSTHASAGTSARAGIASSTSRWRAPSQIERAAMLGSRGVGAAGVRSLRGARPGGLYDAAPRMGARRGDESVPHDASIVGSRSAPDRTRRSRRSTRCCRSRHVRRITMRRNDCRRFEAIRLHTSGGARLGHQEDKKGALGPGMHADFVAFDVDPMTADDRRRPPPDRSRSRSDERSSRVDRRPRWDSRR